MSAEAPEAHVATDEWQKVYSLAARFPFQYYSEVFDPTQVPPDDSEPVVGHIYDDIADIYRDVVEGLQLFKQGYGDEADWQWVWGFQHHWGAHATGAIRALHATIAAEGGFFLGFGNTA